MTGTPSLPAQIEAVREQAEEWRSALSIARKIYDDASHYENLTALWSAVLVTLQQHERLEAEAVEPAITPEMLRAGISVAEAHFLRAHGAWRDLVVAVYRAMYLSRPSRSDETEVTIFRKDIAENTGDPR